MQVIKTSEHTKYFCPLKNHSLDNNRCDGPKCMWWNYMRDAEDRPPKGTKFTSEDGYCGK